MRSDIESAIYKMQFLIDTTDDVELADACRLAVIALEKMGDK